MSKLLLFHSPHYTPVCRRTITSFLSKPCLYLSPPLSPAHHHHHHHLHLRFHNYLSNPQSLFHFFPSSPSRSRNFSAQAFDSSSDVKTEEEKESEKKELSESEDATVKKVEEDYPTGEFEFKEIGVWNRFLVKLRMLIAFPWERVRKGSVLNMKLRGQISDQLKSSFSSGLSLPQICENFIKAAYDPRISGIYLHIEPLNCGWAKVEEIHRHILNYKKSGKFIVCYVPACREKEYYIACACDEIYVPPSAYFSLYGLTVQASFLGGVLEKVGIEPEVQRIGKYKSAGDQLIRKSMSEENCEMLTTLLDNIYGNWLDKISSMKGKKQEEIVSFINEGVYKVERIKEEGLITNIQYDDEVILMLKEKLGVQKDKILPMVDYGQSTSHSLELSFYICISTLLTKLSFDAIELNNPLIRTPIINVLFQIGVDMQNVSHFD